MLTTWSANYYLVPLEQHVHVVHMMLALGCFIEDQQNVIKTILKLHLNFHTPAISQKNIPNFVISPNL